MYKKQTALSESTVMCGRPGNDLSVSIAISVSLALSVRVPSMADESSLLFIQVHCISLIRRTHHHALS